ncbi:MAG: hypothetical protein K9H50_02325 [Aurantimicrobium sp.]|nr:hypothetical protein [Aurantimicrobium sp.]
MRAKRKILTLALAGALTLGATPLLAACSPQQLAQDAVQNVVEDATGVDVDLNIDGKTLPDDFPAEVPMISGEITLSGSLGTGGDKVWTVAISASDLAASYDEAKSKMLGAGYTADFDLAQDGTYSGAFSNGSYSVIVTAANDGSNNVVSYVVSTQATQ